MDLHRYTTILNSASKNDKKLAGKMTEDELKTWEWAREEIKKAEKEGRIIKWDIPFDYD